MSKMVLVNDNLPVEVDAITTTGESIDVVVTAWFKPSEKMPSSYNQVLISDTEDMVYIACPVMGRDGIIFRVEDSECLFDYTPSRVKYWMPLPNPPKGE